MEPLIQKNTTALYASLNTALIGKPNREPIILARIPKGRWSAADDVKGVAVFPAARASDYVTGAVLTAEGGYLNT